MAISTFDRPLREVTVRDVSNKQDVPIFKGIGDVDNVGPYAGTFLLQWRRTLCYTPPEYVPCEFNVDTKENEGIYIKQRVWFPSFMGIGREVKAIFQGVDDRFTYALGWDNKIISIHGVREERVQIHLCISRRS